MFLASLVAVPHKSYRIVSGIDLLQLKPRHLPWNGCWIN